MRALAVGLLLASAIATLGGGCISNANLACTSTSCSTSSRTYQVCDTVGGTVTYKFGGASCAISAGNTSQTQACEQQVASYCGTGGTGSDAGFPIDFDAGGPGTSSGGSSSGGGTGSGACSYTVTGAQTASGTCSVYAAYDSQKGGVAFTVTAGQAMTFGATLNGQSSLVAGTYSLSDAAPGAGAEFLASLNSAYDMCTTSQNCNDAKGNTSSPQGSFTLVVTNPGPATAGVLWSSPQGTLTMTLPAQPNGPASGTVTVTVTL